MAPPNLDFQLASLDDTRLLAARWADACRGGELLVLDGELGAGKTTFVRAFAEALGCDPRQVRSPSYVLHHRHPGRLVLNHLDVYFTDCSLDLERTPIRQYLAAGEVVAMEWGSRVSDWLPEDRVHLELHHEGPRQRRAECRAHGPGGRAWMDRFQSAGEPV